MIRLGHIDYLNCLPLTYIMRKEIPAEIKVEARVPAELNRMVTEGKLDVSPVSSIIYAENYKTLHIIPDVSITTDATVESIIFVSRKPWEELQDARILLTAQSATSHCLCKILAAKKFGVRSRYEIAAISPREDFLKDAEAALFIGDNALYINYHRNDKLYYYDLGALWREFTGHPMVYALWVMPEHPAKEQEEIAGRAHEFVVKGFAKGFKELDKAIAGSEKLATFSPEILWKYLHLIKWELGEEQLTGLRLFYQYAYELGLIEAVPELKFAKVE